MDWSRVKTILIIALLLTNVFLIATLDLGKQTEKEVEDETALISMLQDHGIFVDTAIPKIHDDMGAVAVNYAELDETFVNEEMAKVKLNTRNELTEASYKNAADKFLEALGIYSDSANAYSITLSENGAEVYYSNVIDGIKLDGCYIHCSFRDGKMIDFEHEWLIPTSISGEMSTISASVALMRFMSQLGGTEEVHINDMEPVYWLERNEEIEAVVSDTAFAYWKISYNDDQTAYIVAYEQ